MTRESHSHEEARFRRLKALSVRAADERSKRLREEAMRIAEKEREDTEAADRWVREHGGWK